MTAVLRLEHPDTFMPERVYAYDIALREFLGLDYVHQLSHSVGTSISLVGDPQSKVLHITDSLFSVSSDRWLTSSIMPAKPLPEFTLSDHLISRVATQDSIPVLFGHPMENGSFYFEENRKKSTLTVDVFGSILFMLARLEELIVDERDKHGRFPGHLSIAARSGFLDRPIVNEYVDLLWAAMLRHWPRLERRRWPYRVELTHDVDHPWFACTGSWSAVMRACVGDLAKRRDAGLALRRMLSCALPEGRGRAYDPYNTFEFLMSTSEAMGLRSSFFFMAGPQTNDLDSRYSVADPEIRKLMRGLYQRGHQIGFHGSYDTMDRLDLAMAQVSALKRAASDEEISLTGFGGRQHFLRWRCPETWRIWEALGARYDSSVGFADHAGFRAGTCHEYPAFDPVSRERLSLIERPLLVMDRTLELGQYMGLSQESACDYVKGLADKCRRHGGIMTMLWHNSALATSADRELYRGIVESIV